MIAQSAFGADEQLREVGAGGRTRPAPAGVDGGAVGQDHLEAAHHVLDLPVAGRVLARTPTRQPSAHGRQVHGLGPVPERHPVSCAARLRDRARTFPGAPRPDSEVSSMSVDARQPAHVEGHATEGGDARTAHARTPRHGRDRHPGVVTGAHHAGHLGRGGRDGTPPPAEPARHRRWPNGWPVATNLGPPRRGTRRRCRRARTPSGVGPAARRRPGRVARPGVR